MTEEYLQQQPLKLLASPTRSPALVVAHTQTTHSSNCNQCCWWLNSSEGVSGLQRTLLPLLKVSGGRPSAKNSTTALISCLPVHNCRGRSTAGGGSDKWMAGALPAAHNTSPQYSHVTRPRLVNCQMRSRPPQRSSNAIENVFTLDVLQVACQ